MKKLKYISILFIINLMIFLFVGLSSAEDKNVMNNSEESINSSEEVENIIEGKNTIDNKRFVDNGDGTITDLETNLMWKEYSKFFPVVTYDKAVDYCRNLSYNNFSDWRLPTDKEWLSILDEKQLPPALISGHPFKMYSIIVTHVYWTGTPQKTFGNLGDLVYVVNLYNGKISIGSKKHMGMVWPVRDNK